METNVDEANAKTLLERLFLRYGDEKGVLGVKPNVEDGGTIDSDSDADGGGNGGAVGAVAREKAEKDQEEKARFVECLQLTRWLSDANLMAFFTLLDAQPGSKWKTNEPTNQRPFEKKSVFFTKEIVFFPRNWNSNHWTLGVVSRSPFAEELVFRHYDSLPTEGRPAEAFEVVKRLFGEKGENIVFSEVTSSVKQTDGYNCGLYVCLFATMVALCHGRMLTKPIDAKDLDDFREKMIYAADTSGKIPLFKPGAGLIEFAQKLVEKSLDDTITLSPSNSLDVGSLSLSDGFFNTIDPQSATLTEPAADTPMGGEDSDAEDLRSTPDGSLGDMSQNDGPAWNRDANTFENTRMLKSGPFPEPKKEVWGSIHKIASGADALFGLGPFARRDGPPASDANAANNATPVDPVLLEAQMWLSA